MSGAALAIPSDGASDGRFAAACTAIVGAPNVLRDEASVEAFVTDF